MRHSTRSRPRGFWVAAAAVALVSCPERAEVGEGGHPTVVFKTEIQGQRPEGYAKDYAFSDDWFSRNIRLWTRVFAPFVGQPGVHYLEIGVYEGRALIWMLENVLTHPSSQATGIDIFLSPEIHERYLSNIEKTGQSGRVTTIKGYSQVELRRLPLESFDIIYVDGSHTADDVFVDAALSWGLLKTGGIIVFDDYVWTGQYYTGRESHLPAELTPRPAISALLLTHINALEVLHEGYQMIVRKRRNPCPNKSFCSALGHYTYDWREKELFDRAEGKAVPLSDWERRLLEQVLWHRRLGADGLVLEPGFEATPGSRELLSRLGVAISE